MMIGKMTRYKLVGGFDSPPMVPDPDGEYLKIEALAEGVPLGIRPGEDLAEAIMRHIESDVDIPKNKFGGIEFNTAMSYMIAYTLRLALNTTTIVDGSPKDKKGEALFNSIKRCAKRFPDDDERSQFIAAMERCTEILKGG